MVATSANAAARGPLIFMLPPYARTDASEGARSPIQIGGSLISLGAWGLASSVPRGPLARETRTAVEDQPPEPLSEAGRGLPDMSKSGSPRVSNQRRICA